VLLKNADSFIESSNEIVKFICYFEGTLKSLTGKLNVVRIDKLCKAMVQSFFKLTAHKRSNLRIRKDSIEEFLITYMFLH
jgi:hypothetical protein